MQKNDLVEILAALKVEERNQLLQSWQGTGKVRNECFLLARFVAEYLQHDNPGAFSHEAAYDYIFPGQEWVENKLPKLMSETLKAVRHFVAIETFASQMTEMQQLYYLQNFYNERNLDDKFEAGLKQIESLKGKPEHSISSDYYHLFLLEKESAAFLSARNKKKDDINLLKVISALDEYYFFERLWFTCVLLNQNQIAPVELPPFHEWLPFDINSHQLNWFFKKPIGQILAQNISIFSSDGNANQDELLDFVKLLSQHESHINSFYLNSFEAFAISYATLRTNKGDFEFAQIVLDIQKRRIDSGRIYTSGKIKASDFQSISTAALRLGDFDWVMQFLNDHRTKVLGSMNSEEYYQYNLAQYLYHTQDYEPALKTLLTSNYEDMQYKISAKILEIKILWEMSHRDKSDERVSEFLENKVEAAIIYFFREKNLPASKKKMGKRFSDTMKRIINAEGKRDVERLEIILNDIAKAEYIAERQWLTKLVEDLIGKYKKK